MTKDLLLYESGDGGEMRIINNDIALTQSLYQLVYLALFGGNIETNTTGNELESEQRFDYWANSLFHRDFPNRQFNSDTERILNTVTLNSSGRISILRAVEKDLKVLDTIANTTVSVFLDRDTVTIVIGLTALNNLEERILQLVWSQAKNEVLINQTI